MNDVIALLGNPNCGKTTLFNRLTGTYQKVGNWSGVTTEKKLGFYKKDKRITIVDLPGVYSLSATTDDERAVTDYLKSTPPKAVINIVDGTNLERNLYLTTLLGMLKIPTVIAVNMADDLEKNGLKLDVALLSKTFGVPVIPVSALKNINIDRLMSEAMSCAAIPILPDLSSETGNDKTSKAYSFIERLVSSALTRRKTRGERWTERADKIFTHKIWGIPLFFAVITLVYYLSTRIGGWLGNALQSPLFALEKAVTARLVALSAREWAISLVSTLISGVGTVLTFLPQILVLFALLTFLEESGYSARVAFILDRTFRTVGLSGKSVIPLTVSCGCTVTGLMSTRTIESIKEKRITIFLSPFMPCSAKMAVFAWFSSYIFNGNPLVASSMYLLSIFSVILFGRILSRIKAFGNGDDGTFLLEIPTLRLPSAKDVLLALWEKVKDFILKAGTIILAVGVLLWFLQSFGFRGYIGAENGGEGSFLYYIGEGLKYLFYPLGFGNWQSAVAVLSSILAKEAVIETLTLVTASPSTLFSNGYSAYAFMAFILLSPPCIASIAQGKRELKSGKWLALMLFFQTVAAYLVALSINLVGVIITYCDGLIFSIIIVIISLLSSSVAVRLTRRARCHACQGGGKGLYNVKTCKGGTQACRTKTKRYTTI